MAVLTRRDGTGRIPPTGHVVVNRGHPLAEQLLFCFVFAGRLNRWHNYAGDNRILSNSATDVDVDDEGIYGVSGNSLHIVTPFAATNAKTGSWTIDAMIRITGTGNNGAYVLWENASSQGGGIGVGNQGGSFDSAGADFLALNEGVAWIRPTSAPIPTHTWVHIACTHDASNERWRLFMAGRPVPLLTGDFQQSLVGGTGAISLNILCSPSDTRVPVGGGIQTARVWTRVLNPTEIATLAASPYGFLTPATSARSYFFMSTGSSPFVPRITIS